MHSANVKITIQDSLKKLGKNNKKNGFGQKKKTYKNKCWLSHIWFHSKRTILIFYVTLFSKTFNICFKIKKKKA